MTMLQQIVERGGPAQAQRAEELIDTLRTLPDSPDAKRDAQALIDGFLNGPHPFS